jgi:Sec-independent protein translocase protein TatA
VSINIGEMIVVLLVAVLVIKPENLPDTAFKLGKWFKWLRQTTTHLKQEIDRTVQEPTDSVPQIDVKKTPEEVSHDL